MRLGPFLLVAFIVVPIVEIALFVAIGDRLGLLTTLTIVVATAIVGSALVSRQGSGAISQIQLAMSQGQIPGRELAHGAMILVAAVLLITPGFLTDIVGFLLLVPGIRELIRQFGVRRLRNRVEIL